MSTRSRRGSALGGTTPISDIVGATRRAASQRFSSFCKGDAKRDPIHKRGGHYPADNHIGIFGRPSRIRYTNLFAREYRKPFRFYLPVYPELSESFERNSQHRRIPFVESDSDDDRLIAESSVRRNQIWDRHQGDYRMKLDIPVFDGHLHIEDYLDWEQAVESFFDYLEVLPERQVKYVACKLKGAAGAWWLQLQQTRQREGKGSVRSWPRMKQLLRSHFLPSDFEQLLYLQYQKCHQGNESVSAYTEEFYRLSARNNLNESPQQLVAHYIGGLKESIQDKLELSSIWSLSQAVNFAYKAEIQLNRTPWNHTVHRMVPNQVSDAAKGLLPTAKPSSVQPQGQAVPAKAEESKPMGRMGQQRDNPYNRLGPSKCFRCFQPGHRSNECPNRK